jgi:hypothetical protein
MISLQKRKTIELLYLQKNYWKMSKQYLMLLVQNDELIKVSLDLASSPIAISSAPPPADDASGVEATKCYS